MISDINLHFKRLILVLPQIFASRPAKSKRRLKINIEREAQPANLSNIKVFKILQIMIPSHTGINDFIGWVQQICIRLCARREKSEVPCLCGEIPLELPL